MPHVILFRNAQFHGDHRHILAAEPNLNDPDDSSMNDAVSSLAIFEGNWRFYADSGFHRPYDMILGPGLYPTLAGTGIRNDDMSSLMPTPEKATVTGKPLDNHVMLFRDKDYAGDHKHVFAAEPNLNAGDDSSFNDAVTSIAIQQGRWQFFADSGFHRPYAGVFGPGGLPLLQNGAISNDDMSSLEPTAMAATVRNLQLIQPGVILFKNANLRGPHKHVITGLVDLNLAGDDSFNHQTSSLAVLGGEWLFYTRPVFNGHAVGLQPGAYPSVTQVGIPNDQLASLQPA